MSATTRFWNEAGGNEGRTGRVDRPTRLAGRPPRTLKIGAPVQASVVFDASGNAYVVDMAGTAYGFDPDGNNLWQCRIDGGASSTPAIDDGSRRLFVATHRGSVQAIGLKSGSREWTRTLQSASDPRVLAPVLFIPGRQSLVVSSWGGLFHELDGTSGETRGTWEAGVSPQSGATADSQGNVLSMRVEPGVGTELIRLDAARAEHPLLHQPEPSRGARRTLAASSPVFDDTRAMGWCLFNEDRTGWCRAFAAADGAELWRSPLPHPVAATPCATSEGNVLLADLAGEVHALDSIGRPQWSYASGCEYLLAGAVCDSSGNVYLADPLGRVHSIDPEGQGRVLFEAERSVQAQPSFGHRGDLYVATTGGSVLIFPNDLA